LHRRILATESAEFAEGEFWLEELMQDVDAEPTTQKNKRFRLEARFTDHQD